jgi:hypothetical protein
MFSRTSGRLNSALHLFWVSRTRAMVSTTGTLCAVQIGEGSQGHACSQRFPAAVGLSGGGKSILDDELWAARGHHPCDFMISIQFLALMARRTV